MTKHRKARRLVGTRKAPAEGEVFGYLLNIRAIAKAAAVLMRRGRQSRQTRALHVLTAIVSFMDDTGRARVSRGTVAAVLDIPRPTVIDQIRRLADAGILDVEGGSGRTATFAWHPKFIAPLRKKRHRHQAVEDARAERRIARKKAKGVDQLSTPPVDQLSTPPVDQLSTPGCRPTVDPGCRPTVDPKKPSEESFEETTKKPLQKGAAGAGIPAAADAAAIPAGAASERKTAKPTQRDAILAALAAAGSGGLPVAELARAAGIPIGSCAAVASAMAKAGDIQRVARGAFRARAPGAAPPVASPTPPSASSAPPSASSTPPPASTARKSPIEIADAMLDDETRAYVAERGLTVDRVLAAFSATQGLSGRALPLAAYLQTSPAPNELCLWVRNNAMRLAPRPPATMH